MKPKKNSEMRAALSLLATVAKIKPLRLQPGDYLVATCPPRLPWVTVKNMIAALQTLVLPLGVEVLVVDDGCDLSVVTRAQLDRRVRAQKKKLAAQE